jgi:hypothetical protein
MQTRRAWPDARPQSQQRFSAATPAAEESDMAMSGRPRERARRLTIKQTRTGYWVVQRGGMPIAGAMTRQAAEAERELLRRLGDRSARHPRAEPPGPRA